MGSLAAGESSPGERAITLFLSTALHEETGQGDDGLRD
jgi:hypothetical protein